jgi:hypothetical protein
MLSRLTAWNDVDIFGHLFDFWLWDTQPNAEEDGCMM